MFVYICVCTCASVVLFALICFSMIVLFVYICLCYFMMLYLCFLVASVTSCVWFLRFMFLFMFACICLLTVLYVCVFYLFAFVLDMCLYLCFSLYS